MDPFFSARLLRLGLSAFHRRLEKVIRLYGEPKFWYGALVWHSAGLLDLSGGQNAAHRILPRCLHHFDRPNNPCLDFL